MSHFFDALKERYRLEKTDSVMPSHLDDVCLSFHDSMLRWRSSNRIHLSPDEHNIWREFTVMMPDYANYCFHYFHGYVDRVYYKGEYHPILSPLPHQASPLCVFPWFWSKKKKCQTSFELSRHAFYSMENHELILNEIASYRPYYDRQDIKKMVDEFLRFLSLYHVYPKKRMGMASPDVDIVWHVLISHTVLYRQLCTITGPLLFHEPGTKKSYHKDIQDYEKMLRLYAQNFDKLDDTLWPLPDNFSRRLRIR